MNGSDQAVEEITLTQAFGSLIATVLIPYVVWEIIERVTQ
jgi:hypothetical protein